MKEFEVDCRLYMKLHAQQARLTARMDTVKERILPQLQQGKKSPSDLPYVLVLRKRLRTLSDWKEACKQQLKLWLQLDEKVNARMEEIQGGFAQAESEALYIEVNKSYAAKMAKAG